jgi:hypothetical protein
MANPSADLPSDYKKRLTMLLESHLEGDENAESDIYREFGCDIHAATKRLASDKEEPPSHH